jgi:hypothetical protein
MGRIPWSNEVDSILELVAPLSAIAAAVFGNLINLLGFSAADLADFCGELLACRPS